MISLNGNFVAFNFFITFCIVNLFVFMDEADVVSSIIEEMGNKPEILLNSYLVEVNNLRNSILRSERIICLAPNSYSTTFKPFLSEFPKSFESYVFNPENIPSFLGFAQMSQNTGFLIGYLNEHPEILATIIAQDIHIKNFQYIVRCAIPAIFGYFSSNEHLEIAIKFYNAVIEICDQKACILILQPLFLSSITYRFVENAILNFINDIIFDIDFLECENKFYPPKAKILVDSICKSLPLLPEAITLLLHRLKEIGWEPDNFSHLFFRKFLWVKLIQYIKNSPAKKYTYILKEVIEIISQDTDSIQRIYKELFNAKSIYTIPKLYTPFGHVHLDFYISVHDIHVIAKLLNASHYMPDTVTLDELMHIPEKYEYGWYSCQIFPHIPNFFILENYQCNIGAKPAKISEDNYSKRNFNQKQQDYNSLQLFKGDTPQIKLLNKIIHTKYYKNNIQNWYHNIKGNESMMLQPFIHDASKQTILFMKDETKTCRRSKSLEPLKKKKKDKKSKKFQSKNAYSFLKAYSTVAKSFNMPDINQRIFLTLIERNIKSWINKATKAILDHLDSQFTKLILSMQEANKFNYGSLISQNNGSFKPLLTESVRTLVCLDSASLYNRYVLLQKLLNNIDEMSIAGKTLEIIYPALFQQGKSKYFLSTFIKINYFAMLVNKFKSLCTEREQFLWLNLQNFILSCLQTDKKFIEAYMQIQDQFKLIADRIIV